MDFPDLIKSYGGAISTIIALCGIGYTFLTRGSTENAADLAKLEKATAEKQSEVDKELSDFGKRIQHIEDTIDNMPDKTDLHKLELSITKIDGDMGVMGEALRSVKNTASRIEEYLLKDKK